MNFTNKVINILDILEINSRFSLIILVRPDIVTFKESKIVIEKVYLNLA